MLFTLTFRAGPVFGSEAHGACISITISGNWERISWRAGFIAKSRSISHTTSRSALTGSPHFYHCFLFHLFGGRWAEENRLPRPSTSLSACAEECTRNFATGRASLESATLSCAWQRADLQP